MYSYSNPMKPVPIPEWDMEVDAIYFVYTSPANPGIKLIQDIYKRDVWVIREAKDVSAESLIRATDQNAGTFIEGSRESNGVYEFEKALKLVNN